MGRNGAGKTTLLKMIAGATEPDSGDVRLGASLTMGYFSQQSLDVLDPDLTIIEQLQQDFPKDGLDRCVRSRVHSNFLGTMWISEFVHCRAARNRAW